MEQTNAIGPKEQQKDPFPGNFSNSPKTSLVNCHLQSRIPHHEDFSMRLDQMVELVTVLYVI
jgi:hypothetical protein